MEMMLRVFFNGKFSHYRTPDEISSAMTPDEIRQSEIAVVVGGEIVGRMEADRLALEMEAKIAGEKILKALSSEDDQVVHRGFTRDQLSRAFDLVCDPDDWKAEIHTLVPVEDRDVTVAAIEFYTGTGVEIGPENQGHVEVYSTGYRRGPAGP